MWEPETEQTVAHATAANKLIEQLTEQLGLSTFDIKSERHQIAYPLLKSSIDVAAAATRLLMLDPVQYGSAAESLFRPQLERYLRAVYFGSPILTTDEQVHAFLDDDKIDIAFGPLVTKASDVIVNQSAQPDPTLSALFATIIIATKDDLHGAVHGGRLVVRRYLNEYLAFNPWVLSHGLAIQAVMFLSMLAFSQFAVLKGAKQLESTLDFAKMLVEAIPAMRSAVDPSTPLMD